MGPVPLWLLLDEITESSITCLRFPKWLRLQDHGAIKSIHQLIKYLTYLKRICFEKSRKGCPRNSLAIERLLDPGCSRRDFSKQRINSKKILQWGNKVEAEPAVACKKTLVYFSFRSFQKHRRARERSERAIYKNTSSPTTTPLRWLSINPLWFIFYHPCSTDSEEKIEGVKKPAGPTGLSHLL